MSDVFGGFPPHVFVCFYSHRMEQGEHGASPCPACPVLPCSCKQPAMQCWQAPVRFPWEDEEEGQRCTLCMRLVVAQNSYSTFAELIKTAFPRSARIQAGNCGANTWGFPMEDERSLHLPSQVYPCSFKGCPAHCSSQPRPTWVSQHPFPM